MFLVNYESIPERNTWGSVCKTLRKRFARDQTVFKYDQTL